MSRKPLQPADVIGGRYRVLSILGEGGAGVTYEAEEVGGTRRLAIKQLRIADLAGWKGLELLEREARILAHLRHPRIPELIELLRDEEGASPAYFLVRELVPGASLAQAVAAGWRATEAEVRGIAEQLLEILAHLQTLSPPVIHRDIKPANIIKDATGAVHLVDFGAVSSARLGPTTIGGTTVVGTFGYMAPEQFQGRASLATDLFGVGATMVFLLTHRSPADLPQRKLKVDLRGHVRLSPPLMSWLDRMLEPAPEDRYSSAAAALEALRAGWAIPRPPRRWPLVLALAGTGAGALGLSLFARRSSPLVPPPSPPARELRPITRVGATAVRPLGSEAPPPAPALALVPDVIIEAGNGYVASVAFSPDGSRLASGGADGVVRVWNARTGARSAELRGHTDRVTAVAFTGDGRTLLSGGDTTVWLWDPSTAQPVRTLSKHSDQIAGLALAGGGELAAVASIDGGVKLWAVPQGRHLGTIRAGYGLRSVALSPDGRMLATGAGDGEIRLWDLDGRRLVRKLKHEQFVTRLAFSRDGRRLLSSSGDRTVRAWDVESGAGLDILSGHARDVWGLALAPDDDTVFSGDRAGHLRIWRLSRGRALGEMRADPNGNVAIALDPPRSRVATASNDGTVRLWSLGALPLGRWSGRRP